MRSDRSSQNTDADGGSHDEVNVLALVKGDHRYIFLYADDQVAELKRTFGRWAANPELTFTWYDASVLNQKVCQAEGPGN